MAAIESERREVNVELLERQLAERRSLLHHVELLRDRNEAAAICGKLGKAYLNENGMPAEVRRTLTWAGKTGVFVAEEAA